MIRIACSPSVGAILVAPACSSQSGTGTISPPIAAARARPIRPATESPL